MYPTIYKNYSNNQDFFLAMPVSLKLDDSITGQMASVRYLKKL